MIDVNVWLPIPDFPNYKVRINTNEVKSLNYRQKKWVEKVIVWWLDNSKHKVYRLNKKTVYLHQIVACIKYWYWTPKWLNVCHNDWNSLNNHPDNLRYDTSWSNHKDRYIHWWKWSMYWKIWVENHKSMKVIQCKLYWESIKEWESINSAEKELWIYWISACCKWKRKTAGGFIWKYNL